MATRDEVIQSIALLVMAYPKESEHCKDQAVISMWIEMLADIPGDLLFQAIRECIATLTWFPKIAEVRKVVFDIRQAITPIPDAHRAWSEVLRELDRVGDYARYGIPLQFSHPLIDEIVAQFNWRRLCEAENMVSERAQFIQAYNNHRERLLADSRRLEQTRRYITLKGSEHEIFLTSSSTKQLPTNSNRMSNESSCL